MANLSHLLEKWRRSGLTQREFCVREGIKLATFCYWRQKELRTEQSAAPTPSFAELVVRDAEPARAIEITYPDGTHVRIPLPSPRC